ncbi:MAG: chromosome segregation protein SMC [Acidobacteriota bacterium]|nr:chromosome segregation protein SMC [Acidobacteriota bacterium]
MFKLQRLEITGFKSFADYTEIVFTGSGITAVVGPNGCGKSNVSDAISWVLGEQRAKSLRGEDMKDVVFQGTSRRKPSGMAEVVLHLVRDEEFEFTGEDEELSDIDAALGELDEKSVIFDDEAATETSEVAIANLQLSTDGNGFHAEEIETVKVAQVGSIQTVQTKVKSKRHWRPRSFALDFAPGEAVSVTRRLYLSGESEYQLNGKSCRLRDIQDLFAGTGLSGAHYALIEQGKIGQILSSKPADRRNLIEEAAGISKFRTRQRAAETRLESAKTNLSRISDIVSEIEKQVGSLQRQAAKTRRYKILREEFRTLLRQLFAAEGRHLTDLAEELDRKLEKAAEGEREIFARVGEKDESFRAATGKAREREENLSELRAAQAENVLQRDRNQREQIYKQEQIENLEKRSALLKSEIEAAEQRRKLFKSEIERLKKDEQKERGEAEENEIALREAENKYNAEVRRLREIETEIEANRAEVLQHTTSVERLKAIEHQLENTIERLTERAEGLQREGERAFDAHAEHEKEAKNLARDLSAERGKLAKLQAEKQKLLKISGEARTVLLAGEKSLNNAREDFSRTRHRLETLRELEEKRAVYAPSVQKLFAEEKKIGVKFLGTLADKFTVDARAEKAVENLFGNYLQTILVESDADARKTFSYLNENNLGRISVLIVQSLKFKVQSRKKEIQNPKSKTQNLKDFLGLSDEFAALLEKVFPLEMSAQLVENFDGVKAKDGEVFVSFDGDLLIGGKLLVCGKQKSNEKNLSLLAFKRELRELESAFQKSSEIIKKAEKETEKARAYLSEQENKIVDLQSLLVKIEREALSLEIREKSIRQEAERADRHRKVVSEETKQIGKEIAELLKRQKEALANAEKAEQARTTAAEKLAVVSNKLSEARAKTENENAALNEKITLAATTNERRRSAQAALKRIENEQAELDARLARLNLEVLEIEGKAQSLTESIKEIERKNALADTEQTREQNELAEATTHLKLAREQADATSTELAELNRQAAEARNERAALEIKQAETITRLRNINEKCAHELNLSLVELVENQAVETDFDLEDARKTVEDLRAKLENFGAINMLALEELSDAEERLLFLTAQRKDIIDGIAAAEEALREIKARSREKFKEAFYAINRNFTEFFSELFGGGRGEMTLLEAEDVLEAGIEIVAQPPGKRLQNILLLSGGEKAMTAIALVMAIFRFRPAPFCLLDEVDAPLDDANVGRFVNKIATMSEKTQFIVITHNKRTMEAARALYGVTMQEAGVSKVVSVRFE